MNGLSTLGPLVIAISVIALAGRQFSAARREWQRAARLRAWPTTTGTITESRIKHDAPHDDPDYSHAYTPYVTFEHTVDGITYTNPEFIDREPDMETNVRDLIAPYPVGERVTVHYDPRNPRYAVLDALTHARITGTLVTGAVLLGTGVVMVAVVVAQLL